ncbi:MAG: hypothetical protein R2725_09820 [Solirubrobacterales bacterium]
MTASVEAEPKPGRRIYPDVVAEAAEKTRAIARQGERALGRAVGAAISARRRLDRGGR